MRLLPHTEADVTEMLRVAGVKDVEDLFRSIPPELITKAKTSISHTPCERDVLANVTSISNKNVPTSKRSSFLGAGAYNHYVPAAVSELASRSEFVTPYTPYQPEISQGTLQVLFEYQTMISNLFAMDVSNASHYSGATALADACLMAKRITGKKGIVISDGVHPQYREVVHTVAGHSSNIVTIKSSNGCIDRDELKKLLTEDTAAVIAGFPNFFGIVEDLRDVAELAHQANTLFISVTPEPLALAVLTPPGDFGADIAVGEGISFGLPLNFGGPTLGIFTTKEKYVRQMPGRVCGKSVDVDGKTSYTLTLSTREQHIRREKATSNICSNQALCATTAAIYLSLVGKTGLRNLAMENASLAAYAQKKFSSVHGVSIPLNKMSFNEFVLRTSKPAEHVLSRLNEKNIAGGVALSKWYPELKDHILVCCTEMNSRDEIDRYANALTEIMG